MITCKTVRPGLLEATLEIPYQAASEIFQKLYKKYPYHFLLESIQVSLFSGRFSLIGIDPVLKITGKDERFEISTLNERGSFYLDQLSDEDFLICDHFERSDEQISGTVLKEKKAVEESQRSKLKNIAQIIRLVLEKFAISEKALLGLYGAFSYDFIRLFEDLQDQLPENEVNDFTLFLYDSFIFFDHIKEKSSVVVFRENEAAAKQTIEEITDYISRTNEEIPSYQISDPSYVFSQEDFESLVLQAKEYIKEGELFQLVFVGIFHESNFLNPGGAVLQFPRTTTDGANADIELLSDFSLGNSFFQHFYNL